MEQYQRKLLWEIKYTQASEDGPGIEITIIL